MKFSNLLFSMMVCGLFLESAVAASLNRRQSGNQLDCTKYQNDYEILSSFEFEVQLNPLSHSFQLTYGLMDEYEHVHYLNIVDQENLSSTVFCFKHLNELYLRNTRFNDGHGGIPAEIERLAPTLIEFGVYDTPVKYLPEQISKMISLRRLIVFNTGLTTLPDSIGNLVSLTYLCLSNNQLTSLPATIVNISLLLQIDLSHNPNLGSIQSLNGHPYLRYLQANNCSIKQIPQNLPQLTDLYMTNNKLRNLVNIKTLGNEVNNRKYFYFDKNSIQTIPPQIRHVKNCYFLNFNSNQLKMLPSDIFSIKTLHYLHIQNNPFNSAALKEIDDNCKVKNPSLNLFYTKKQISTVKF